MHTIYTYSTSQSTNTSTSGSLHHLSRSKVSQFQLIHLLASLSDHFQDYKENMAVVTYTEELTSPVPAPRLFTALFLEADTLLPKIIPQAIKSIETLEGNGGPGTIKQLNLAEGSQFKYVKHRIDELDKEKMIYRYSLIEGDALMEKIEYVSYEISFEATPDGGCKSKNVSEYHPKPGVEIKEEEIKHGKEKAAAVFRAVEAYLLANPDACA